MKDKWIDLGIVIKGSKHYPEFVAMNVNGRMTNVEREDTVLVGNVSSWDLSSSVRKARQGFKFEFDCSKNVDIVPGRISGTFTINATEFSKGGTEAEDTSCGHSNKRVCTYGVDKSYWYCPDCKEDVGNIS